MWGLAADTRRCQPAGHDPRVSRRVIGIPRLLQCLQAHNGGSLYLSAGRCALLRGWWPEPQTYNSRPAIIRLLMRC